MENPQSIRTGLPKLDALFSGNVRNQGVRRKTLIQFFRYFVVAFLGLVLDFGTLAFCTEILGLNYLLSATFGFAFGLVANFFLSERYVFFDPIISGSFFRFSIYALVGLIGLGILISLMWVQVETLGVPYLTAKALATVVVYTWNFFARRMLYRW